ncbi:MAG: phosphotransferase family protein, partial [Actinomycetes bacterium]
QWSRPGWLSQASSWMKHQMLLAGYEHPEEPQIHWIWGVSVVLSAGSASGTAYLKCSGDRFVTEPVVTRTLAQHSPTLLPQVFAIDADRGWMLMRDMRGTPLGEQPPAGWGEGLVALQRLQQQWLGRTQELIDLGAEERSLATLTQWVERTTDDTSLMSRLASGQRRAWSRSVPAMIEACRQLDTGGPGPTLVHGDFHPWNVFTTEGGVRVFDWTDASVSHPFVDLVTYIGRSDDLKVRQKLVRLYLTRWDSQVNSAALTDLTRIALVVGSLHQAHTYSQLIPTVMPDDVGQLRDGDVGWLARAMRFADDGLDAQY